MTQRGITSLCSQIRDLRYKLEEDVMYAAGQHDNCNRYQWVHAIDSVIASAVALDVLEREDNIRSQERAGR